MLIFPNVQNKTSSPSCLKNNQIHRMYRCHYDHIYVPYFLFLIKFINMYLYMVIWICLIFISYIF